MRVHYNSWRVLSDSIPRGSSEIVGKLIGATKGYVQKWRREPESDDAPTATGYPSPHDAEKALLEAVEVVNPAGVDLLLADLQAHVAQMRAGLPTTADDDGTTLARIMREHTEASCAIALKLAPEIIEKECLDAIAAYQDVLSRTRRDKQVRLVGGQVR